MATFKIRELGALIMAKEVTTAFYAVLDESCEFKDFVNQGHRGLLRFSELRESRGYCWRKVSER